MISRLDRFSFYKDTPLFPMLMVRFPPVRPESTIDTGVGPESVIPSSLRIFVPYTPILYAHAASNAVLTVVGPLVREAVRQLLSGAFAGYFAARPDNPRIGKSLQAGIAQSTAFEKERRFSDMQFRATPPGYGPPLPKMLGFAAGFGFLLSRTGSYAEFFLLDSVVA